MPILSNACALYFSAMPLSFSSVLLFAVTSVRISTPMLSETPQIGSLPMRIRSTPLLFASAPEHFISRHRRFYSHPCQHKPFRFNSPPFKSAACPIISQPLRFNPIHIASAPQRFQSGLFPATARLSTSAATPRHSVRFSAIRSVAFAIRIVS